MAAFVAMVQPGDTVMGMNLNHGGHLTHGSPVNFSGLYFNIVPYGVNDEGFIDYDEMERIAVENKPKLIIAGASAYGRTIDFKSCLLYTSYAVMLEEKVRDEQKLLSCLDR